MNEQIKGNSSLLLAYQQDSSTIPSDFTISCLFFTKPKGIFELSFHIDDLIVCGTNQGPIILIDLNKNENKLQRVSLLCGHSFRITDFAETLQGENFLSISANCTICLWSLRDGSCLLHSELSMPLNNYKLTICPSELSLVWVWAPGSNVYLFNLENEQIIYSLPIGGLNTFSILSPHTSYCVSSTCAVCSTVFKLITYSINNDQTLQYVSEVPTPNPLVHTKVCQRGIIQYNSKEGNWSIIRPNDSSIILFGTFELDNDDYIFNADWKAISFFCIATFKAQFLIISMTKTLNQNSNTPTINIESTKIIKSNSFNYLYTFCIIENNKVAFSPDSKTIVLLSENSQVTLTPPKSKRQFNIVESEHSHPYVVCSDEKSTISFYNAGIQESENEQYTFNGKITAIHARNNNMSNTLQIINGYSDGSISFWNVGTDIDKAITVYALSSPVIAFIEPPLKLTGRQLLLAISKNECCLLKTNDVHMMYNLGTTFSILEIYYISITNYLVFYTSDGLYIGFSINSPDAVFECSQLPQNSVLIYSNVFTFYIKNFSSIVCLRLANQSLWFQFLDISNIHKFDFINNSNNQVVNSLNIIDQIATQNSSSTNNKNDKLFSSLVIIGKKLKPTFFYPYFSVNLENILYASPSIAAKHFLIKRLVAKMKSEDDTSYNQDSKRFVDFVPILIKLMYEIKQDSEIQQICAETCASLNFLVSFSKAQSFVSPLLINYRYRDSCHLSDHELLLMSLFTARYQNIIPSQLLPELLDFLLKQLKIAKNNPSVISALATFILIDGIHIWLKLYNDNPILYDTYDIDNDNDNDNEKAKKQSSNTNIRRKSFKKKDESYILYLTIIKSVIINKNNFKFLYDRFLSYVYSEDISVLVQILPKFIKSCVSTILLPPVSSSTIQIAVPSTKMENAFAEAALDLYSEIELNYEKISSGWLSVAISSAGWKFPKLAKKAFLLMKKHAQVLSYIEVQKTTVIIGTSSGHVYIFVDSKLKGSVQMFSDKVDQVSIGPNEECGLAISKFENIGKVFKIKQTPTIIHVMDIFHPPKGTKFSITWLKNNNASISFVPI